MFIVGIDPDIDKNGVALLNENNKGITLLNLRFFELYDFLNNLDRETTIVYVEGGWLNKSNWHIAGKNQRVSTQIGKYTGENHQAGKKIIEMCEYLKLKHEVIKPTRSKIKADSFKQITGITQRTNQEQRDACMLIFGR